MPRSSSRWLLRNIYFSHGNVSFPFSIFLSPITDKIDWVIRNVSCTRQELLSLHRDLGSPRSFCWIHVANLFSFLCCFACYVSYRSRLWLAVLYTTPHPVISEDTSAFYTWETLAWPHHFNTRMVWVCPLALAQSPQHLLEYHQYKRCTYVLGVCRFCLSSHDFPIRFRNRSDGVIFIFFFILFYDVWKDTALIGHASRNAGVTTCILECIICFTLWQ
jgi:hypothetical protein